MARLAHFVFTADTHVHPFRGCSKDGGADRRRDGLEAVRKTLEAAQARGCAWIHGGDVKQVRGYWDQESLSGMLALMSEFRDVPKMMLAGNGYHDGLGVKTSGVSGLDPFRSYAGVVGAPEVRNIPGAKGPGGALKVACWPWAKDLDELPAFLEQAKKEGVRVLFAHGFLREALVGDRTTALPDVGIPMEKFGLRGRPKSRTFDVAFFGDVHKRQCLNDDPEKGAAVWYPGSPYAQNWAEKELDKGCLYVEIHDIPKSANVEARVTPLVFKGLPRFRVLEIGDQEAVLQKVLNTSPAVRASLASDFVRLVVSSRLAAKFSEELKAFRAEFAARHFEVVRIPEAPPERKGAEKAVHAGLAPAELIRRYVAAVPPPAGLPETALANAGLKLL